MDGFKEVKMVERLFLKQSIIHSNYLFFTFLKLEHYCSDYPVLKKSKVKGKIYYSFTFNTRTLPCLQEFNTFYLDGRKVPPSNLWDLLNYEKLAHWIKGDGTRVDNALILQTDSFTVKEVVYIMNVLLIKKNIKTNLHLQRGNPVIYIKTKSVNKIREN